MNKTTNKLEKSISILGCGWLGLPLAKSFVAKHITVKGSTPGFEKFPELEKNGIIPYRIFLNPKINPDFNKDFFHSDILVVNFPPKRREDIEIFHLKQFESLLEQIHTSPITKVILISSTSVYANVNREVTEQDEKIPEKSSGRALRAVEQLMLKEKSVDTTIIRFGGLIGYDRKPGRFFATTKQVKNGDAPVNLIHQDDCISIIHHVIENELWGEIYNACCPEHPTRKDFYYKAAKIGGYPVPVFENAKEDFKIINSDKLRIQEKYQFKFENPIDALKI